MVRLNWSKARAVKRAVDRGRYVGRKRCATTRTTANGIDGAKHSIEYYQREYKWGTKQISELLEGLEARFFSSYGEEHERKQVREYIRLLGDDS